MQGDGIRNLASIRVHSLTSSQSNPLPVYPALQVQLYDPSVFAHHAVVAQGASTLHSSTSLHRPSNASKPAGQVIVGNELGRDDGLVVVGLVDGITVGLSDGVIEGLPVGLAVCAAGASVVVVEVGSWDELVVVVDVSSIGVVVVTFAPN